MKTYTQNKKMVIKTLMWKVLLILCAFIYREMSGLIAGFDLFALSRFNGKKLNPLLSTYVVLLK